MGNIYRSLAARRLLRQLHLALTVSLVGPEALMGKGMDPCAISVAQEHSLSLDNHCAQQTPGRMCREYDLILTMEERHITTLCEVVPKMCGKVMFFGHQDSEREIPDPYHKSRDASGTVYALLERSARQQAQVLNTEQRKQ